MIPVFIELPVFSERSAHWTTLCGFTGLYSSSAVGLDLGTESRVDRASEGRAVVAHAFNPSTREAEAGGSL